ncbi:putative PEP-binding protein [Fodinicola feengrottensis]|uniref:putative PEP-binding protein n=1 Tax=Fodinicola feengrottensis TaxID=435914 RepID=UPI002441C55B|nr:putative PEP-binding protein [Fodinicola feengrottensis]
MIDCVTRAAGDRIDVAVCGELAADELAVPLLVGLGVRELSVAAAAIPLVKQAVRRVDMAAATALAQRALQQSSARAVRGLCGRL